MENFHQLIGSLFKKTIPIFLFCVVTGAYLVFRATGRVDIWGSLGIFALLVLLTTLVAFCITANADEESASALKATLDVLSLICMVIFLVSPWWLYLTIHSYLLEHRFPVPLLVFGADALPFIAGMIWISSRYARRYPSLFRRWIILVVILGGLGVPLYLMKISG